MNRDRAVAELEVAKVYLERTIKAVDEGDLNDTFFSAMIEAIKRAEKVLNPDSRE
jgi:hypothetical protein